MKLFRSINESEVYGLELYRGSANAVAELDGLVQLLYDNQVDVLRLKVSANQKDVYSFLNQLGVPYQLYNLLYVNEVSTADLSPAMLELPKGYGAERCNDSNRARLESLVSQSIELKTWINYDADLVRDRICEQTELQASIIFADTHCGTQKDKLAWILRHDHRDIGFVTGMVVKDVFYGTLCGISPEHRTLDHAQLIYKVVYQYCRDHGLSKFVNHIGVMNIPSQRTATKHQMVPKDVFFHFELYPFLRGKSGKRGSFDRHEVQSIEDASVALWNSELENRSLRSVTCTNSLEMKQAHRIDLHLAVDNEHCALVVATGFDDKKKLIGIQYLQYK